MTSSCSRLNLPDFSNFDSASAEKKIIRFIQKSVKSAGVPGVVLGLSGGIDSALAAALAVKALGAENVHPVFFYESSSDNSSSFDSDDLRDASALCDRFSLSLLKINLHPTAVSASSSFDFSTAALTAGNLKSRLRMSLLYYYANQNNLLVLGTKNKTERLIGYFTKHGDGGVDIDPLSHLYKTEIRLLSKYIDIPDSILTKTPSAGFWKGQSDEAELGMSYEQLDVLLLFIESDFDKKKIARVLKEIKLTPEQYEFIRFKMNAAKHKQKMPKSLK
jgi:NAD+ synthetase